MPAAFALVTTGPSVTMFLGMPGPVFSKCVTRFRMPWEWDGKPVVVQSRATDEKGNTQPTRAVWKDRVSPVQFYQYNAIQAWAIGADNTVKNIYV